MDLMQESHRFTLSEAVSTMGLDGVGVMNYSLNNSSSDANRKQCIVIESILKKNIDIVTTTTRKLKPQQ